MERIIKKRNGTFHQVECIYRYVISFYEDENPKIPSPKVLESKKIALLTYREKYERLYEDLIDASDNEESLQGVYEAYDKFQNVCTKTEDKINELQDKFYPVKTDTPMDSDFVAVVKELVSTQLDSFQKLSSLQEHTMKDLLSSQKKHSGVTAKLPKLDLISFSGGYTHWGEFYDTFKCAVDQRKDLAPVQKLQYLKSCLKGEPATLIKNITLKDENYDIALQQLRDRYDNIKIIRDAHFENIFNFTQLTTKSASGLRKLCSVMTENVRALENLGEEVHYWDSWLVYIISKKLDAEIRLEWEKKIASCDKPVFKEMVKFLNEFACAIESTEIKPKRTNKSNITKSPIGSFHTTQTNECFLCKGDHRLPQCCEFTSLSPYERKAKILELKLCLNCLSRQHFVPKCPKPPSCRQCGRKHHPSLHFGEQTMTRGGTSGYVKAVSVEHVVESTLATSSKPSSTVDLLQQCSLTKEVLLGTTLVRIYTPHNQVMVCRALVDPGSQASFITRAAKQRLQLKGKTLPETSVNGIGCVSKGVITEQVECQLFHLSQDSPSLHVNALVIDKVTAQIPKHKVNYDNWKELNSIHLADKNFNQPGPIDILLGADVYPHLFSNEVNSLKSPNGDLLAQQTMFGWIITGTAYTSRVPVSESNIITHFVETATTDEILRKFWEIEEIGPKVIGSEEERLCENHFKSTFSRGDDGRYTVSLPLKNGAYFGESRTKAVQRLQQIERRFKYHPEKKSEYAKVVEEYFELKHAELVPDEQLEKSNVFYMPHHSVIKEDSSTTKLRVVFDASAKTSNGLSLNEQLMIGSKVQDDLLDILIRFRQHPVAFSADITKMYRQVKLTEGDRDLHRFVWRRYATDVIRDYRMTVVTFGIGSSAFHAQRVLKQLAIDEAASFPLAAPILDRDFYMDDCLSGASSIDEALELQKQLINMLRTGGFHLRKWSSNDSAILKAVSGQDREVKGVLDIDFSNSIVKTLGSYWHVASDTFLYKVQQTETTELTQCLDKDLQHTSITKRKLLSQTARIFDPLGLLAPTLMIAKALFQSLWQRGFDWDQPLTEDISKIWRNWNTDLMNINGLSYNRYLKPKNHSVVDCQLHRFGDASETGYAGVVYMRTTTSSGDVMTSLVAAKTKLAPIKKISIPRLELCAAQLTARLLQRICSALVLPTVTIVAWSDSTVTLDWISGNPNRWKTFVANRVSEIQELVAPSCWRYCPTKDNPSDCASRGIFASDLLEHKLWWNGPRWLVLPSKEWPTLQHPNNQRDTMLEQRRTTVVTHALKSESESSMSMFPYSSLSKLIRITAWCYRWRLTTKQSRVGPLSCTELQHSLTFWIKNAQAESFIKEISYLQSGDDLPNKSRICSLCPFIDQEGVLRVGGRLKSSCLSFERRHPILLPKKHPLTNLILDYEHKRNLHAGSQLMMSSIQKRYWILGARDVIRKYIHKCTICRRYRASKLEQIMASLPPDRVNPSRAFEKTGVDYAGPLLLKYGRGRGSRNEKCWVALFVCLATKAVHIELVSRLSTEAFLATLRRFVSRRGKPHSMYSDNGTNFVGANRELKEMQSLLKSQHHNDLISKKLAEDGIEWHFSPQKASHFGGLWEAGIKSTRYHLNRVVGNVGLTFEEMSTVLAQIEACLNSRPISALSSDPDDLEALTPGHFLIGTALNTIPDPDLTNINVNRLSRWQHVQLLQQHFWKRWSSEYLTRLQQRPKWYKVRRNLKENDLVMIAEDNLPPGKWALGRVVELHAGKDGYVRVVTVRTSTGHFKRPIVKLVLLLANEEQ